MYITEVSLYYSTDSRVYFEFMSVLTAVWLSSYCICTESRRGCMLVIVVCSYIFVEIDNR